MNATQLSRGGFQDLLHRLKSLNKFPVQFRKLYLASQNSGAQTLQTRKGKGSRRQARQHRGTGKAGSTQADGLSMEEGAACSRSCITRERQMKSTIRCHFTPSRLVKVQSQDNTKCWQGCAMPRPVGVEICAMHFRKQLGIYIHTSIRVWLFAYGMGGQIRRRQNMDGW